jgi:RNA binding exosome subunit
MIHTKERLLHHVIISVFSKPHDDDAAVRHGLDQLSPVATDQLLQQEPEYDPERPRTIHYRMPDAALTVQKVETDEGRMVIYTLFFRKMSAVNIFAHRVSACLTPQERQEYAENPESLLDAEGRISLRLDKELLQQGRLSLTPDGNCYQVKASVAAYPKKHDAVIAAVRRIIG